MMCNVLVFGNITSETEERIFLKKGIRPAPADIVQKYLIDGLTCDDRVTSLDAICSPRVLPYPKTKLKRVHSTFWSIDNGRVNSIGYWNFPVLGFLQREYRIVKEAKKWASRQNKDERQVIIVYSMHSPFLAAVKAIKSILPNSIALMIVPDLPEYMGKTGKVKRALKQLDRKRMDRLLHSIDKYALYTKYMADYFNLNANDWIVFEGLIDTSKIDFGERNKHSGNVCIYAGSLQKKYAIGKLVESFGMIHNAELWLYGDAKDAAAILNEYSNIDNVFYKGSLSQAEMFEEMKKATLLINPRPSDLTLTKYSCPSKTFEYLASGTPVVMTKLPGLPEEYYQYLYFFDKETVEGFADKINEILSLIGEELEEKSRLGRKFLIEHKDKVSQSIRLIDFILGEEE